MSEPKLPVKISKKLKTLTLSYGDNALDLDIVDGEINLILLDMWITDLLMDIHDKTQLRKRLSGDSGGISL